MEFEPNKRISAQEAIEHPWIINIKQKQIKNIDKNYFSSVLKNIKNFNAKEKLQQATIAYIVHFLYSSQELEGLKKVFKYLDKNGDGRLTYGELRSGFDRVFGRYLSDLEMNKVIEEVDGDNDGYISYEEFLRVATNRKKLLEEKNLKLAFDRFDVNKDGRLSREELKKVLGTQENQYINLLLIHIDKNNDGFISFPEFCELMNGVVNSTINSFQDNQESNSLFAKLKYSDYKSTQKSTNLMTLPEEKEKNKIKTLNTINSNSNNYLNYKGNKTESNEDYIKKNTTPSMKNKLKDDNNNLIDNKIIKTEDNLKKDANFENEEDKNVYEKEIFIADDNRNFEFKNLLN